MTRSDRRTKIIRGVVTAVIMATTLVPAVASTAHADASTRASVAAPSAVPARCHWIVLGDGVRVRTGPGLRYSVVRLKYRGEEVTGPAPCIGTVYADGYWWVRLYLGSGGYGWTAEQYLGFSGYF